jgi:CheY-like chemotaxis protein
MAPGSPDAHLVCPKCKFHFALIAPQTEGQPPTLRSNARVLVVDDAHFFREMLVELLMPLKLNLRLAASAAEALEQLQSKPCDLVLLDLNLPDRNGLELIADIRAEDSCDKTRILAMSGVYRREEDGIDAIRAGADGFINKSFRPEDLREKVRKLLP